jgi:hypothetical protein
VPFNGPLKDSAIFRLKITAQVLFHCESIKTKVSKVFTSQARTRESEEPKVTGISQLVSDDSGQWGLSGRNASRALFLLRATF